MYENDQQDRRILKIFDKAKIPLVKKIENIFEIFKKQYPDTVPVDRYRGF